MSWSRFTDASVYTFPNMDGRLECCACLLMPGCAAFTTGDVDTFLTHLDHHRGEGHDVPDRIFDAVRIEGRAYVGNGSTPEAPR